MRIRSVMQRLNDYLDGRIEEIEELECEPLSYSPAEDGTYLRHIFWDRIVSAGLL